MKLFLLTMFNGLTLAALYFIVACGFSLMFGLMRNINLAHGSLYLLGGYIAFEISEYSGSWLLGAVCAFFLVAALGAILQLLVFKRLAGQELRQTLVSIGLSIVMADLMLAHWGGGSYQLTTPEILDGSVRLPLLGLKYPAFRLSLIAIGFTIWAALWLLLSRTRIGMTIRAGVDDADMLRAAGVNVDRIFVVTFAIGAGLAGLAGAIGGTVLSLTPGEDVRYLLSSLVVVIVGGMGNLSGAAISALLIGMADTFGLAYTPTYGVVYTFLIMITVLAVRPQGLLGRSA